MYKLMTVRLPDGTVWGVPMAIIARNRAQEYAHELDGDVEKA